MENYLQHHGILGQRWGVRRYQNEDGSYTEAGKKRRSAENYSSEQRIRDKRVYSSGAVKRINKRMLKGEGIQSARSAEATRINKYRNASAIGRQAGGIVGVVGGAVGGYYLGKKVLTKVLDSVGFDLVSSRALTPLVMVGTGKLGQMLGSRIGSATIMSIGGYSPSKYR